MTYPSAQIEHLHNHFLQESEDYNIILELYADDVVIMDRKYEAVMPN